MNKIWSAAQAVKQRATILKQEAECLAKNPTGAAQRVDFVRIVKREISGLYRDLMDMGASVLTEIDNDLAATMRGGVDLLEDRDCPAEQWASYLICTHPDVTDNHTPISAVRVTVHGLHVRYGDKDLYFQAEPLAVKK